MVRCDGFNVSGLVSKKNAFDSTIREFDLNPDFFSRGNKVQEREVELFKKKEVQHVVSADIGYCPSFIEMMKR
jgi:hypothetical protein